MNHPPSAPTPPRRCRLHDVVREALVLVVVGGLFGLAANALSPRGLELTRNYFPAPPPPPQAPETPAPLLVPADTNVPVASTPGTAEPPEVRRLRALGFQPLTHAQVVELFNDPRYGSTVVFVDARDDKNYQAGHIPGAWQFDHYRPQTHIPVVVPVCVAAELIVVYCTGGDCEDSEFATLSLRELGVPPGKIYIYAGGLKEWSAHGLPLEIGARNSGQLRQPSP